jgi:hypothetical protein
MFHSYVELTRGKSHVCTKRPAFKHRRIHENAIFQGCFISGPLTLNTPIDTLVKQLGSTVAGISCWMGLLTLSQMKTSIYPWHLRNRGPAKCIRDATYKRIGTLEPLLLLDWKAGRS